MIVTKKWLDEYIDLNDIEIDEILKALNSIGLEVDSHTKLQVPKGVVIGRVLECQKHPNADKLNVCQVDIGDGKTYQIVCGASNIKANQFVPVATIGAKLDKNFIIKKATLRGVESYGMICSASEIGLPKVNDGILELDDSIGELILGKELSEYELLNDDIIEIELTANRGDCLNIIGIAKELGVYFNKSINLPEFNINEDSEAIGRVLEIDKINSINANLIYKVANIKDFYLPLLYKFRLSILNINKKTNIENLIEYATHLTGVIFNVYTKKIAKTNNEKIKLDIKENKKGFTEVSGKVLLSTIGIEKGEIEECDDIVVIESSYIDPTYLAKRVFETKQKTGEIYYKTSRGSNPNLEFGIDFLSMLISNFNGLIFKGEISFLDDIQEISIDIQLDKINKIIGQKINPSKIEHILTMLGFNVKNLDGETFNVIVPNTRHDIRNIADIAEEIVRIVGIDNIKSIPLNFSEKNRINKISNKLQKRNTFRKNSINQGFFETVTYVFSQKELLEKFDFELVKETLDIANPITNELNSLRTTLLINLILGVKHNKNFGFKYIPLFEIGKAFDKDRNESEKIAFIHSGAKEYEDISNSGKPKPIDFFTFVKKLINIIGEFELKEAKEFNKSFFHPYQCAKVYLNSVEIGILGKIHPKVAEFFDIESDTFVAEFDFNKIELPFVLANDRAKFQASIRDLSLLKPKGLEYYKIKEVIKNLNEKNIKRFNLIDIYSDESLGEFESITLRFVIQDDNKTLSDEEINDIMDRLIKKFDEKLGIKLR